MPSRGVEAQGWPWSKVKTEEERYRERPSVRRVESELATAKRAQENALQSLIGFRRALDGPVNRQERRELERMYQDTQYRLQEINENVRRLERERDELYSHTPQGDFGNLKPIDMPDLSSSEDESSVGGGVSSRRPRSRKPTRVKVTYRPRLQSPTVYRDARTGRFVSMKAR